MHNMRKHHDFKIAFSNCFQHIIVIQGKEEPDTNKNEILYIFSEIKAIKLG